MKFARRSRKGQHEFGLARPIRSRSRGPRRLVCEPLEVRQLLSVNSPECAEDAPHSSEIMAVVNAVALADPEAGPLAGTASPGGFSPAQLKQAYGYNQVTFNGGTIQGDGTGQTIAIVTAYHTPTMAADLAAFSTFYGLPPAPSFVQVAQDGSTNYPGQDPAGPGTNNWHLETALDVEWVHALAPGASILLVEANSPSFTDLTAAVNYAKNQPGVSVVSLSWGANEFPSELSYDAYFTTPSNHAGVAFVGASGDSGSPGMYPAFSSNVLAVGGTTLTLNGSNNIQTETAWSGSGGGISQYQTQPSYQNGFVTQSATMRTSPDVAFVGNPSTGVPVYDTYNNSLAAPWTKVGGTSFGAPAWAALVAIANQGRALAGLSTLDSASLLSKIYTMPASNFNDITSGSSGGSTPQAAGVGYDLATGRGTPKAHLVVGSLVGTASISGTVFNDLNGNGSIDGGESGLAGWTIYADLNGNSAFDPVVTNTIASTDVPKSIPSLATVTSNNTVSGLVGDIVDINVKLNISHTRDSDLILTLISPSGTRITLANRVGGSGDHFTNTIFDDAASVAISLGSAPFAGSYQPLNPLAVLYDTNPNGTWQLEIQDVLTGTSGTLNSWSLEITTGDPNTTSNASGNYSLLNLPAGSYVIREVLQNGYVQTAPGGAFFNSVLSGGANVTGQNFGNQFIISATPTGVSLLAASDTGVSNSDAVTRLNNANGGSTLQFQVSGTIAGATVSLYADGVLIGSAVASGTTTTVTTDGSTTLSDGVRFITARQTESGKPMSPASPAMGITVDTAAPTAVVVPVAPDPQPDPISSMAINFSEAVSGMDQSHLSLTRDGGANLLTGAQGLTSGNSINWTLSGLESVTGNAGVYTLLLSAAGAPITDQAGNALQTDASDQFTVMSLIIGRRLFYNNSKYDGNNAAANAADDGAIATDKVALLPGAGPATFANVSSYTRGINGIMLDLAGNHPNITAADFTFSVGNNNTPSTWSAAPAPVSVVVRAGAGLGGSDRVQIVWADGAITNTWLQVVVAANANTGLPQKAGYPVGQADVFYFGNAVGDSGLGDTATMAHVNVNDYLAARNNPASLFNNIPTSNAYDYNRDGAVNTTDELVAKNNFTGINNVLRFISVGSPPAAPEAAPSAISLPADTVPTASAQHPSATDSAVAIAAARHRLAAMGEGFDSLDEDLLDLLASVRQTSRRRR